MFWRKKKKLKTVQMKTDKVRQVTNAYLRVEPGCSQNIGNRAEQEDAFSFSDFYDEELSNDVGYLAVLADGMGGLEAGRTASNEVVNTCVKLYTNKSITESIQDAMIRSARHSNEQLNKLSEEQFCSQMLGTTLIMAVVYHGVLNFISIGDSSIYLYSKGTLKKLNVDHNYGMILDEKVKNGIISNEEAMNHPERAHLISFLGMDEIEHISRNEEPIILEDGDVILLCSDGLTNTLDHSEISNILIKHVDSNAQETADVLLEQALLVDNEQQDNITIEVLKYHGE